MSAPVVLCFGDSNTHGTMPLTDWATRGRYPPEERWPNILAAGLPHLTVIAEGHPGRTTLHDDPIEGAHKNGLAVLPSLLESHRPIDLVIVMLGSNDMKARFSVTPHDIGRSLDRILTTIAAAGVGPGGAAPEIILVSPPLIDETGLLAELFEGAAAKSRGLALRVAETAAAHGAAFLDAGPIAPASPVDGLHLTPEAHRALADHLIPLVADRLPAPG
ncbi:GDSL-type esterase/lipase family protein [Ovoidimarina sediminis]|uniref:GDSL-type esterase/lipase family protein n=1 Tax=Ovoidimarina sediminis TaxID=3079856 RepID=UPI00290FEE0C|nr:GDSL-type esterase/lipase family protein [Rhodophyticola sp. MJ-SS7]MDU8943357.1 GDSL-type esterase/lipase family protein [Rhodophyticola sp. MJ-SS7]